MPRPRVIVHVAVSLDGNIDGFDPDVSAYYGLIETWDEEATLCGSETILAAAPLTLIGLAFRAGFVDELSLLVHPVVSGNGRAFVDRLDASVSLRLIASSDRGAGLAWLRYGIER